MPIYSTSRGPAGSYRSAEVKAAKADAHDSEVLPGITANEVAASICRSSFYEFVKEFWDRASAEKPHWNWHIEYLCDELQDMAGLVFANCPKEHDLIDNQPPGTTKSMVVSIMFPAWVWTVMPSARFICGSYSYDIALDLSRKCRDVIKSEKYRSYFPEVVMREDQDAKGHFINTKGGERYAFGVGGSVFGKHAHFLIIDDPLNPMDAVSEVSLKTCNYWMNEVLPSRKVDKLLTPTILVMQRLHQNDPTGDRLEKAKKLPVKWICLPAELTDHVHPPELREKYVGGLLDAKRLNRQALTEHYEQLGEFGYASQFLQHPVPRGTAMFHVDMLQAEKPPERFKIVCRYWDKAGTQGGGAFTAGVKIGLDMEGTYWVLDVVRGQWDSSRREKIILETAIRDAHGVMIATEQEPGSGGKESAENTQRMLARAGFRCKIHKVGASDGDKERRADPFSVQVNGGNVKLALGHWNRQYVDELRYFPNSKFKDQTDASSGAFNIIARGKIVVGGLGCKEPAV